ncbi:MAG: hypothetical protein KGL40_02870 [Rhodocyclaceae bacterium]|nr:hypothetical protein [Rhodocyclaceae bacterium]
MSLAEAWRISSNLELACRDWDEDEVVVFSQRLGHSLLLSAASARVLDLLATAAPQTLTQAELVERLLPLCAEGTPTGDIQSLLDVTLPEFYRIGLAEPWINSN